MKKGYKHSEETKEKFRQAHLGIKRPGIGGVKKGHIPWNKGKKMSTVNYWKGKKKPKDIIEKAVATRKKNGSYIAWSKGIPCRKETKEKLRKANLGKRTGLENNMWKGGITPENHKIRTSSEFKLWRKVCFERDNFTCQKTGQRGGKLVVHHINNFADFPELRLAIDNGITLSNESHIEFHKKYGYKNNTKEQLAEFLTCVGN